MDALRGKVAIVTGGGSGIGEALVTALTGAGASVLAVDMNAEALASVGETSGAARHVADVADASANEAFVARAVELFGGIDLAFLNAGVLGRPFHEHRDPYGAADIDLDQYRLVRSVNMDGVVYGTIAVAKAMAEHGGGSIIATASIAGLVGWTPTPMYSATKHAVVGWVRALAPALVDDAIRLNAICPAGVSTPLVGRTAADAETEPGVLAPRTVAEAMIATALDGCTGEAITVVAGRDPISMRHDFSGIAGFPP